MSRIPHDTAYRDHQYLWAMGPAFDMTGAYVDQDDLARLLRTPTKNVAADCLSRQIGYWFQAGPDVSENSSARRAEVKRLIETDTRVREIYERYVGRLDDEIEE